MINILILILLFIIILYLNKLEKFNVTTSSTITCLEQVLKKNKLNSINDLIDFKFYKCDENNVLFKIKKNFNSSDWFLIIHDIYNNNTTIENGSKIIENNSISKDENNIYTINTNDQSYLYTLNWNENNTIKSSETIRLEKLKETTQNKYSNINDIFYNNLKKKNFYINI